VNDLGQKQKNEPVKDFLGKGGKTRAELYIHNPKQDTGQDKRDCGKTDDTEPEAGDRT
jgi:hypothetical protein